MTSRVNIDQIHLIHEVFCAGSATRVTHAWLMARLGLRGGAGSRAGYALTRILCRLRKRGQLVYEPATGWRTPDQVKHA